MIFLFSNTSHSNPARLPLWTVQESWYIKERSTIFTPGMAGTETCITATEGPRKVSIIMWWRPWGMTGWSTGTPPLSRTGRTRAITVRTRAVPHLQGEQTPRELQTPCISVGCISSAIQAPIRRKSESQKSKGILWCPYISLPQCD